jgi:hypothetical protein
VFLLGLTHSMSQLFFGIPREYAFLFFHNNRDTASESYRDRLDCFDFAHFALCVAAIFFLTAALMTRFFLDVASFISGPSKMWRTSLLRTLICFLIDAARLSC